jgi:hypothetical protein
MTELPGPSFGSALISVPFAFIPVPMASLLTPPTSRSGSELPEDSTAQCLDELLERYLCLLDQQQKLQSSLSEQLSSVRVS